MAQTPRRVSLGLLASSMLVISACSSNEVPETLPMLEAAPATAAETQTTAAEDSAAADRVEAGIDAERAELSAEQQAMLDRCADTLTSAAASADVNAATYSDDVTAILMDPSSGAMESCGMLFDPSSGIDQGVVISFMLEALPPELLGTLSALATMPGPDGTPLVSSSDAPAADDAGASDATDTLQ